MVHMLVAKACRRGATVQTERVPSIGMYSPWGTQGCGACYAGYLVAFSVQGD